MNVSGSLNRGPKVGAKVGTGNSPPRGGFNADGKPRASAAQASKALPKMGVRPKAKLPLEGLNVLNAGGKVHAHSVVQKKDHASSNLLIPNLNAGPQPLVMPKWPQHERLKAEVNAYTQRAGVTQETVAQTLGIKLPTLRCYIYGTKRPSIRILQKATGLFACPITAFVDDPTDHAAPDMDETARWMAREMTGNLAELSPQQRQAAFSVWQATIKGLKG